MPLYEYECDNCGNHFERIQSVHDEPVSQCPNCSSNSLHKVFHAAGIIFKGSGWYVTDSRKSSSTDKPPSESKPSTETKTESREAKTESKEAKTESKEAKTESRKETSESK